MGIVGKSRLTHFLPFEQSGCQGPRFGAEMWRDAKGTIQNQIPRLLLVLTLKMVPEKRIN